MIKNIISRLTMVKTDHFYDFVRNEPVYYWKDIYFDEYIATSRWGKRIKLD